MPVIKDYEALSDLVSAHLLRGVQTNTMVTEDTYGPAIQDGTLTAQTTPAGLLLTRDRGDHARLNFYLNDMSVPLGAELTSPTVTEVAFRPRDTGLQEAVTYLQEQGFSLVLERVRLSRPATEADPLAFPLYVPRPEDTPVVMEFLQENFSSLTGCLPTEAELAEDLAHDRFLILTDCGSIGGLLHFSFDGKSGEIRHLAIREDLRGKGFTRPLLQGYLEAVKGAKSVVWTGADDAAAQAAYEAMGFTPDGRRSAVLCYNKKEG